MTCYRVEGKDRNLLDCKRAACFSGLFQMQERMGIRKVVYTVQTDLAKDVVLAYLEALQTPDMPFVWHQTPAEIRENGLVVLGTDIRDIAYGTLTVVRYLEESQGMVENFLRWTAAFPNESNWNMLQMAHRIALDKPLNKWFGEGHSLMKRYWPRPGSLIDKEEVFKRAGTRRVNSALGSAITQCYTGDDREIVGYMYDKTYTRAEAAKALKVYQGEVQ